MIVIADTTPLNYLVLIGEIDILPALYGRVVVPRAVFAELDAAKSPSGSADLGQQFACLA